MTPEITIYGADCPTTKQYLEKNDIGHVWIDVEMDAKLGR